jgi:hypothetical protein
LKGSQLYWRAVRESLSSKALTIIDPRAAGQQHLLLADPAEIGGRAFLQRALPQTTGDQMDSEPVPFEER